VLEALSEVERALSSFRSSQERIAALEEAVRAATEAAELADQRYAAGLVDLLSVLDTQRTLFSIEEQLVITQRRASEAFSNLYRALGGGWDCLSGACYYEEDPMPDTTLNPSEIDQLLESRPSRRKGWSRRPLTGLHYIRGAAARPSGELR
jgi:hypothetical protein